MLRILIVDDDFLTRKAMHAMVGSLGPCDLAANGVEALEAFREAFRAQELYDLVCLDLRMPTMDGHQVLKGIRLAEELNGVQGLDRAKVIMITASKDPGDVKTAFRGECDGYVMKPVRTEDLMARIREAGCRI